MPLSPRNIQEQRWIALQCKAVAQKIDFFPDLDLMKQSVAHLTYLSDLLESILHIPPHS